MKYWEKLSTEDIKKRVFNALSQNVNFYEQNVLGLPASHLDDKVFYQDAPFLKDAPFMTALVRNPNHIGCHTITQGEFFFKGTQELERELIALCAENIMNGAEGGFDGYVAAGGTEANMQAAWIYRNYFMQEMKASAAQICLLCSRDSHYSVSKAANVLNISLAYVDVEPDSRTIISENLEQVIVNNLSAGKKFFIVIVNMMTTMFGSVDDVNVYMSALDKYGCQYKIHIDGAYGGFFYPFTDADKKPDFANNKVTSITMDAHKMVQAPYGTGIFLIRKDNMAYANTKEASYIRGEDYTLIGSRSGANAVAVWMILMTYGRYGWEEKIMVLLKRTAWLEKQLQELGVAYFRDPYSNIITIRSRFINKEIAEAFGLVPDKHEQAEWYKIVVMEHVDIEKLIPFVEALRESLR